MAVFSLIAATAWGAAFAGTAIGAATIAIGQAVTWSLASALLTKSNVSRQTVQATVNETAQPRVRGYGRNLLGGVRAFFDASDDVLRQIVVTHHGPIDGLIQFWMDGKPVDVNNNEEGYVRRYVRLKYRDGSGEGGDYRDVREVYPDLWTADHRLQNQATFYAGFGDPADEDFAKEFPKGSQTVVQMEVRASRVADLNGDPIYSENAGLCIRDLFTHPDGWNIPVARLDEASWATFTGICAQPVPLASGAAEPRYRLCGYYTLEDALKDVTGRMLATCDGQIYETAEGRIGILGGAWSEPDVTISGDDILSVEMDDGYDPLTVYNVLQGSFVSPAHAYQEIDVAELVDEVALETEEVRTDRLDVDMCPSGSQLQRLMKIRKAKDRREMTGMIQTNLVGLKARFPKGDGIHTIRLRSEEFGLDGVFEVKSHAFSIEDGICEIGVASIDNPYPWNAATEERPLPPTYASIGTAHNTQAPPQYAVIAQSIVTISGDVQAVKLGVTVDDPGKDSLTLQAQVAPGYVTTADDEDAAWIDMSASRLRAETGVLDDGETFTIRIKWRGRTDWVLAGSVSVVSNPDAPAAPTRLTGIVTGRTTVSLDWINAAEDFYRTQILRSTSASFAAAAFRQNVAGVAGQVSDFTETVPPGTWYYWAVTINPSAVPSAPAGPVVLTIT